QESRNIRKHIEAFLFPVQPDEWLSVLRIGAALQVIFYCLMARRDWIDTFSLQSVGIVRRDLTEAVLSAESHAIPRIGWLVDLGARGGAGEQAVLEILWWALLLASLSLLAGVFCRWSAVITAFLHF